MKDTDKTKEQLIAELLDVRNRNEELELFRAEKSTSERSLREDKERFQRMADNIQDGLAIVEKHKTVYVNDRLCEITGYSREELLHMNSMEILTPESREMLGYLYQKYKEGKEMPRETEYEIIRKDGTRRIIRNQHFLSRDGDTVFGYYDILSDITEKKAAEKALQESREQLEALNQLLEKRVEARTAALVAANENLKIEIHERRQAEEKLKARENELSIKTSSLEELNAALKVLLKKKKEDEAEVEHKILSNVNELVVPYLEKAVSHSQDQQQGEYLKIALSNLNDIVSPFAQTLSSSYFNLTPQEIRIANLIKEGKTTKDLADLLHLSIKTIDKHRENIRKKLKIANKKTNLRTFLLALQ